MQQTRRPGRPARRTEGAAAKRVYLRATEVEREDWTAAAKRAGLTLAAWLRLAAEHELEQQRWN